MPIKDPNNAREVEAAFKRVFDSTPENRANEVRKLFAEVLDFEPVFNRTVSLPATPSNVSLPATAERIAQLDGFHVLYIDLNTVDTDRVRKAEVEVAAKRIEAELGEDILLIISNMSATQLHIILPDFSSSRLVLRRMVVTDGVPRRTIVQQIANIYADYEDVKDGPPGFLPPILAKAFAIEPFTDEFFDEYQRVFKRAEEAITGFGDSDKEKGAKRLFTQTLFNRLMFVHFLSRKGWLSINDDKDYLRALWTDYSKNAAPTPSGNDPNFYRDRLRVLFSTGLNNPDSRDVTGGASHAIGSVPFLNGGLFEESDLDNRDGIHVPDSIIESALTELFEKFNFTVMESTPYDIEVAVDPEMLGKVFEELVNERHDSGAYYTPRPVVAFMCREALKGYLEGKETGVSAENIASFIDTHDASYIGGPAAPRVGAELDEITVVDPACGSGAFLLGMMQELVELRDALFRIRSEPGELYKIKLHIIQRNLYGVDINEFAVNIAMLRLWLSLAIDFDGDTPPPLPNLDFKIVRGDSLLGPDPSDINAQAVLGIDLEAVTKLAETKAVYMRESDGTRKTDLKDEINRMTRAIEVQVGELAHEGVVDWRVEFAELFTPAGGFDVAIANPPYVRQENIGPTKTELTSLYADAAVARSDLYCYFYARALQLLAPGGTQVFVCSNSWLDVGYGAKLQEYLLTNAHLQAIYESAVERQFSTADINTIISVIRKGTQEKGAVTRFISLRDEFDKALGDMSLRRELMRTQETLLTAGREPGISGTKYVGDKWGGKYLRAPDIYHHILDKKADKLVRLGDVAHIRRGITTGANDFFYLKQDKIDQWGIEPEYLRPVMTTPQESRRLLVDPATLPHKLFMCHENKGELQGTAALAYIKWGEKQGYHTRSTTRSRPRWWAGLDEIKNRRLFPPHAVARHGHGVRQYGLVSIDLDALNEVTDERLPLGDRPILQEVSEVRHVLHYLLGVGQDNPALLKPGLSVLSRSLQLLLPLPQGHDAGRQDLKGQIAALDGLVDLPKPLPHVLKLRLDHLQPAGKLTGHGVNLLSHQLHQGHDGLFGEDALPYLLDDELL
ncbi:MAG: N-6 DNA methylase, partial [Chloroflexi bacterium]|nr:N-6 DNA methylase [Chloroflexota bacterium]